MIDGSIAARHRAIAPLPALRLVALPNAPQWRFKDAWCTIDSFSPIRPLEDTTAAAEQQRQRRIIALPL